MSMFTPLSGLLGGGLIGLAADILLLGNGDIMGASGIVSTTVLQPKSQPRWKWVFLSSFLTTATFVLAPRLSSSASAEGRTLSTLGYALAGLFVGFGTKLGNGCTSGHGICGLGRFSKRSLVAVLTFMATGITTAIITSPKSAFSGATEVLRTTEPPADNSIDIGMAISVASLIAAFVAPSILKSGKESPDDKAKIPGAAVAGSVFAAGLHISQMAVQVKVHNFLDMSLMLENAWDPTLMMVMGGGLAFSFLAYQLIPEYRVLKAKSSSSCTHPMALSKESTFKNIPKNANAVIDSNLVVGAALFGVGWGIGGICPGPAILLAGYGTMPVITAWWPSFFVGSYMAQKLK